MITNWKPLLTYATLKITRKNLIIHINKLKSHYKNQLKFNIKLYFTQINTSLNRVI